MKKVVEVLHKILFMKTVFVLCGKLENTSYFCIVDVPYEMLFMHLDDDR